MRNKVRGFTAIELLVVMGIVAILAGLAMPSFQHLVAKLQMEKDIEALRASIFLARSEAMKQGGGIQIRKLTARNAGLPNSTCTTARDWSCGWEVIRTTPSTAVIRQYPSKGKNDIMLAIGGSASTVSLNRWGVSNAGFSLNVQHKTMPGTEFSKVMCVSSGGGISLKDDCTK